MKKESADVQLELVRRFLAADEPRSVPPLVKGPIAQGQYSKVFYAETAACPHPLAVKLCISHLSGEPDSDDARRQFDALQAVEPYMPHDRMYTVPRPYKLDAGNGLVAIEWFDGQTLTSYLRNLRYPIPKMLKMFGRAGTWLKHFHSGQYVAPGTFDAVKRFRYFQANLTQSALHSDRTFVHACELLEQKMDDIENQPFSRAWLHGDFKSDNLLACGDRLVGIDIHAHDQNLVLWDIVPFLNRFGLLIYSPYGWHLKRYRSEFEQHFLHGYFARESTPREAAAIAWLRLLILLQQWDQRHLELAHNLLKRSVNDWIYRQDAKWLCAKLLQSS